MGFVVLRFGHDEDLYPRDCIHGSVRYEVTCWALRD